MRTLQTRTDAPRIYVACLAAYNNGHLHGRWIDANQDPWTIWDEVSAMLRASPIAGAEEYAVHDYEGFQGVRIEEYTGIERVAEIAAFLGEHGPLGGALITYFGGDLEEAREAINDRYLGCHPSLADYMQDVTEETTIIPQALRYYIDWNAMAWDAEMSGDILVIETAHDEAHVFASG